MPNYKTHDRAAYLATPVVAGAVYAALPLNYTVLFVLAFLAGNHWLSPDLDIDSIMSRRWGILSFLWYPYKRLIHHRSIWSHSGPLSAAVRMLYLSIIVFIPLVLVFGISALYAWLLLYWPLYGIVYLAVALADLLHTTLDLL